MSKTTTEEGREMGKLLTPVADAIQRLDKRRHVSPARLELSHADGQWVAQIMADPLLRPLTGSGEMPETAVGRLVAEIDALDWRRVGR